MIYYGFAGDEFQVSGRQHAAEPILANPGKLITILDSHMGQTADNLGIVYTISSRANRSHDGEIFNQS